MGRMIACLTFLSLLPGCDWSSCEDTGEECDSAEWSAEMDDEDPALDDPKPETFAVTWVDECTVLVGVDRPSHDGYLFGVHATDAESYVTETCVAVSGGICHTLPISGYRTLTSVNTDACGGDGESAVEADNTTLTHRSMSLIFTFYSEDGRLLGNTCRGCQ